MTSHCLHATIDKPTRVTGASATLIDNIFTNALGFHLSSAIIQTYISDHYPICLTCDNINFPNHVPKSCNVYKHDTRPSNLLNFQRELSNYSWFDIISDPNPKSAFSAFSSKIINCYNKNCPLRRVNRKTNLSKSPWITNGILNSIKHTSKLFRIYRLTNSETSGRNYRSYRNVLTKTIRSAKKSFYTNFFNQNKMNSRKIWRKIGEILNKGTSNPNPEHFECDGGATNNPHNISRDFNEYFSTVAANLANNINPTDRDVCSYLNVNIQNCFIFYPATNDEVLGIIRSLENGKSPGHDNLS